MCQRAIFGLLLLAVPALQAGEVLDRIVASVNSHTILQSDWDEELRYESFMAGRIFEASTPADRTSALDRLVDQQLLEEQVRTTELTPATSDEVEKQLQRLRDDHSRNGSAASWNAALSKYGLGESEIRARLTLELNQLRLVDARLRPSIQIDAADIEKYYNDQFLPELRRSGAQPLTLQEAGPQIREILIQQKINEALASWLEALRSQAQIRIVVPNSPEPDRGQ